MSIASELTRLQQAKADIKTAIEAKGVEVPSSALISDYDDYIAQIEGGGGCSVASANSISFDDIGRISSVDYKEGVTSIPDYMFYGNTSLSAITLPSTIQRIGFFSFSDATNLSGITLPNGLGVIEAYAFNGCTSLSSITIPDSVIAIGGGAFSGCRSLTNANIPSSVEYIDSVFGNCQSLQSISIPNSVKTILGLAFSNCWSLSSVTLPSSVETIGDNVFDGCSGLTAITVEATTPPTMNTWTSAFNNTNNCPIYVPCDSVEAYKAADGWSTYASRIEAISGTCPFDGKYIAKNKYSDATIASATCSSAADSEISANEVSLGNADDFNLEIGTCAESIGANAFRQLPNMKSLKISNSLTNIGNFAFSGCTGLYSTTVDLKNVQTVGQQAFRGISGITLVANSLVYIREDAFRLCRIENTELSMPNINSLGARSFQTTRMADSSFNRGNLILGTSISSIGDEAFADANMNITLLATVPPTLGTNVFLNLTGNIYVPSANVSDYQNASGWSAYANKIQAIPSN